MEGEYISAVSLHWSDIFGSKQKKEFFLLKLSQNQFPGCCVLCNNVVVLPMQFEH